MVHLSAHAPRVECPEHGVHVAHVPWARHKSRFTHAFEDTVAWLLARANKTVVANAMRIDWKSVGGIAARVKDDLEGKMGKSRFENLVDIGIDETSCKKGRSYMTVVVDHDNNRVVWAHEGYGKEVLRLFFEQLNDAQRASIRCISADGARWIAATVKDHCPDAIRVMDPFHVVSWATDELDKIRKEAWAKAHKEEKKAKGAMPARGRGRPRKGDEPPPSAAKAIRGTEYALLKNPEGLTESRQAKLEIIARADNTLFRAYRLKEDLRSIFKMSLEEATAALDAWLSWAARCRIEGLVALSKKMRRHKGAILAAIENNISNARIESMNNKIKLTVRMAYGFRNIDNLIALVYLRCSSLPIALPGRLTLAA
jgi:transposase